MCVLVSMRDVRVTIYLALCWYGVATISSLLQIVGLFCRISSRLWGSFAKETYHFKEPTNRSHPIYLEQCNATWSRACESSYRLHNAMCVSESVQHFAEVRLEQCTATCSRVSIYIDTT